MGLFDRLQDLRDTLEDIADTLRQKPSASTPPPPPPQSWQAMDNTTTTEQPLDWDISLPEAHSAAPLKPELDQNDGLRKRLHSRAAQRQAIVIREILDQPLALRRRR